jgi:hypothetical protein
MRIRELARLEKFRRLEVNPVRVTMPPDPVKPVLQSFSRREFLVSSTPLIDNISGMSRDE